MDRLVEHCFVFEGDGEIRDFPGNYTQYREWRTEREQQLKVEAKKQNEQPAEKPTAEVKNEPKRKLSFNEKREFEQLESEIAALENEKEQLNEQLNSGALSAEDLLEASNKIGKVIEQLDEKELRWLELSEYQQ
jgi:ATP-binding cassette subfamily F protein uup